MSSSAAGRPEEIPKALLHSIRKVELALPQDQHVPSQLSKLGAGHVISLDVAL